MFKKILLNQRGVAALVTIVVISATALIMAYTASLLGMGELELGYTSQQSSETMAIADGCLEEGLRQLRLDAGYTGGTLNLGNGSCIINVSGSTMTSTATLDEYNKKIEVEFTLTGNVITIDSWQEVSP